MRLNHVGIKAGVVFACAVLGVAVPAAADTAEVGTTAISTFTPADVVITVGDSVHWSGLAGGSHNVAEVDDASDVSYNGGFHSADPANEFTFTFNTPGVFHYVCEPHIGAGMRGTVTVEEAAVPAVSTWGMAALVMLVMVAGTVVFRRVRLTA